MRRFPVTEAEGGTAVSVSTPYCWLQNVHADGSLQTPAGSEIQAWDAALSDQPAVSPSGQSRLVENCIFNLP